MDSALQAPFEIDVSYDGLKGWYRVEGRTATDDEHAQLLALIRQLDSEGTLEFKAHATGGALAIVPLVVQLTQGEEIHPWIPETLLALYLELRLAVSLLGIKVLRSPVGPGYYVKPPRDGMEHPRLRRVLEQLARAGFVDFGGFKLAGYFLRLQGVSWQDDSTVEGVKRNQPRLLGMIEHRMALD